MEGDQYLAINPSTLDDNSLFSYRDLQQLCIRLGLGGKGNRLELQDKLHRWHRQRHVHANEGSAFGVSPDTEQMWVKMFESCRFRTASLLSHMDWTAPAV
jgi:hypothetical protein